MLALSVRLSSSAAVLVDIVTLLTVTTIVTAFVNLSLPLLLRTELRRLLYCRSDVTRWAFNMVTACLDVMFYNINTIVWVSSLPLLFLSFLPLTFISNGFYVGLVIVPASDLTYGIGIALGTVATLLTCI